MSIQNIEIKARSNNHDYIRSVLRKKGARYIGRDYQKDTYFQVLAGRLKLREGNIENYLIYYERLDDLGPKPAKVMLEKVEPGNDLCKMLKEALGVLIVVEKEREIYFIGETKIHLDQVKGLGAFAEIEVIDKTGRRSREHMVSECRELMAEFQMRETDLISDSYSDLLMALQKQGNM